jgi:hypothetical protein
MLILSRDSSVWYIYVLIIFSLIFGLVKAFVAPLFVLTHVKFFKYALLIKKKKVFLNMLLFDIAGIKSSAEHVESPLCSAWLGCEDLNLSFRICSDMHLFHLFAWAEDLILPAATMGIATQTFSRTTTLL